MHAATPRPDFAPENRSSRAGKLVAISVVAILLLGTLATLVVVMRRGSSGFVPPARESGAYPFDRSGGKSPADDGAPATETAPSPAPAAPTGVN